MSGIINWIKMYRKQNIVTLFICMCGVGVNILFGAAVSMLGLPLYLDTLGTIVVAALGGYLPGVVVGFTTNIIKSFYDPSSLYYGVLNVMIAVAAAYTFKREWNKKFKGIVGMIAIYVFIGGGIGALIPWFMEGLSFDSESLSGILYETGFFNIEISHLLSSILMDIPDKAVTVILVLVILLIIPDKIKKYFVFEGWEQSPIDTQKEIFEEKAGVRVLTLKVKIMLVLVLALTMIAVIGSVICLRVYHKAVINEHKNLAKGTSSLAANMLDGDKINEYLMTEGKTEGYKKSREMLEEILSSSPEIAYLYVYKVTADNFEVVFDIDTEDTPAAHIGDLLPLGEEFAPYLPTLLDGGEVEPIITNDEYGYLLTAASPVYDSFGNCVCYAIADVDMEEIIGDEKSFLMELASVFLGFFILICTFVIWLIDYHIIYPVRSITKYVDDFSFTVAEGDELDELVRRLRKLNVHTGDEIEKLYSSICRMTLSQAEQTRSISRLSDSTAKLQDGLIITMADLVESRDSDTGAHVQKTAAYVKIIVNGLKAKGYYLQKISPKFISDTIRSAPLHDVGKINIPDGVLNKPGKLTDEEYEIMKTHTTQGKKIIENAISKVKGDSYLKEARNMAAYHHERWDGKGYPEGLHGEVIPLSARIMAVADVFDALTSPRVYKPAFPLEEALRLLEEGSGTQFDPKCVEVFMESLDEVKVILRKYNEEK